MNSWGTEIPEEIDLIGVQMLQLRQKKLDLNKRLAAIKVEKAGAKISCAGCYFDYLKPPCWKLYGIQKTGVCNPFVRSDKESVIFVEVEDDKNKEGKL